MCFPKRLTGTSRHVTSRRRVVVSTPQRKPQPTPQPSQLQVSQISASSRVLTGELSDSDNVLLNIFRCFLDVSPRHWHRLVHICRKWRRIVFASQRALNLRLLCTHGAPVLKMLDCWPTLPIVVQFAESPALNRPTPEDEDGIMAALKESTRVRSINLTVTSSLLAMLYELEWPFLELEELVLVSRDSVQLTLPRTIHWGSRLRRLHVTRLTFPPTFFRLHFFSRNLMDLQLHEVLDPWHFPPEDLTDVLSRMPQLRSLSLHFLSTANYRRLQTARVRATLPVLSRLDFRGITGYLECLVGGIDVPCLGDIEITFFNEVKFDLDLSQLNELIDRIGMHRSHCRAYIISSERVISISLTQPGAPTYLKFHLVCEPLRGQLFSMARICHSLSAFLFNVEDLHISATRPSRREDRLHIERWLDPINSFEGINEFHISGNLSTSIVRALQLADTRRETVLPALHKLYIPQPEPGHEPLTEAVVSFMISRLHSGHPIAMEYERPHHINELHGAGPISQQVTVEVLPDDIILDIFRHYLNTTTQSWPKLVRVCQRWRQIVSSSPLTLNLRVHCTYQTPVLKALDSWPALPIVVQYGGLQNLDTPAPEDDDNIIAALKQSSRVRSISLTVTRSLLEKLSEITEPFLELEELTLLSNDSIQLSLPSTFRCGPRLRTLHSTRTYFPSFPQPLSSSQDLVDLQLHEILGSGYFSPEAIVNALSGMTQLRSLSLSLHFLSLPNRRGYLDLTPKAEGRVVLSALTFLKYQGTVTYLDGLVARIDAHRLQNIDITFFSQPRTDTSQLGRFIQRIEMQRSFSQAVVQTSAKDVSVSLTDSNASTPLRLRISCKQSSGQLSSWLDFVTNLSRSYSM